MADSFAQLDGSAQEALCQIKEKQYDAELKLEGYHTFSLLWHILFSRNCAGVMAE